MGKKKSYKEKRLARQAKAKAEAEALLKDKEARQKHVEQLGQVLITKKFQEGKGRSRHLGKQTGDNYRYITSEKAFRDNSPVWKRFSGFVAEHSAGDDLETLEDIFKYADLYIEHLETKMRSAWTLTTYKAHLGKVFNVPTTAFKETAKRERRNARRSRYETSNDSHISKEKRDFFEMVGSATGLRKKEMMSIRGTALFPERAHNGLWYFEIKGKGGRIRRSPILARTAEEEAEIIAFFQKAGDDFVFSGKHGTHRVPQKIDEHANRAEYAKRVYLRYERDLDKLPRKEKTFLRKELSGNVLDKSAELKTAEYLGHNRIDEFRKSYAYKLV